MKRILAAIAVGTALTMALTGCAVAVKDDTYTGGEEVEIFDDSAVTGQEEDREAVAESTEEAAEEESTEEEKDTGDASKDNIRNQDGIGENELLVISFGTSFNDSRRLTIGAIEDTLEKEIPDYAVRRGFTSNIIIDHVNERDGILIDDVDAALKRAVDNKVKNLVIQPTHLMSGFEYNELTERVGNYADAFESVSFGEPLLTSDEDFAGVEKAITDWTKDYDDGKTAIVFMGHGTEADSNGVYAKMQELLTKDGFDHYYIGTVEAEPSLEDVMKAVKEGGYERVVLEPLMVVAGDHANNDMAGDEDGAWKKEFEKAGYKVECLIRGLGENEDIRKIYVEHAKKAIEEAQKKTEIASDDEKAKRKDVSEEGMDALFGKDIKDGSYEISVRSSSDMFNIEECSLNVKDGVMTADMTMGGKGYLYVYMGSPEDAVKADEKDYIKYSEKDGKHVFSVPVEALDKETDCAAFSKKKEKWYDRVLVFESSNLPSDAYKEGSLTTTESLGLKDGEYKAALTLEGGSGKASVQSPAKLTVKDGKAFAVIVWSSPNYDYMIVDGEKYLPVNKSGNSAFEIPVSVFDKKISVKADTTAMSKPHEIDYTLEFDSSSVK